MSLQGNAHFFFGGKAESAAEGLRAGGYLSRHLSLLSFQKKTKEPREWCELCFKRSFLEEALAFLRPSQ